MKMEPLIRVIAGSIILASLALAHFLHPYWLVFTLFVGINLVQSGFTNRCLLEKILARLGVQK